MAKQTSALAHYASLGPDRRAIEAWLARLCDVLFIYELTENKDLTRSIVRLGYLSDFELYSPVLMGKLFRDIEAAL